MEAAGRQLLPSHHPLFLPKAHLRNSPSSSSSVTMLHEQATPAVTSVPTASITRNFPSSVLLQEQRDEFRPLLHFKDDKMSQVLLFILSVHLRLRRT
ncbi:hypothetical protein IFM89_025926 [Coptis chinensis]|uniref:Uncharacterized protein n=1 Tax=Coptis chinensis TaxID=261450 RepID=A0A835LKH6_9MAGN|nr:hypothetical protein IFM89_025926 [Coptis chinensis]